ncbi:MAG TPA: hypothetical protein VFT90_17480 [Chryseosolibacter sp.]|nr:hypothetical protein [Chryseosolibacter sp.]
MTKFFFRFLLLVSVLLVDGLDQLQGSANDSWAGDNPAQLLRNALCAKDEIQPHANASIDLDGERYLHTIDLAELTEEQITYGPSVVRKKLLTGNYANSIHCWQARSFLASYRKHILRRSKDFCHIASRRHLFLGILRN